ncbi:hypothetical protein ACH5RR_032866 [Cinchona calisaya]|uniref:Asn/Gln amidotransferase domain-containing protein n=1 Tax=Cinchona calisaya TaxID=153742 RepID=A0ABD2YLQ7_9GENT
MACYLHHTMKLLQVEMKNLNSFSSISRAIDFEISRQVLLHSQGQADQIVQETRLWEESTQKTVTMRKKEGHSDYRYFPEPDLPGVSLGQEYVDGILNSLPELPETRRWRYENMGLSMQDVLFLTNDVNVAEFFDAIIANGVDIKLAANWIMGDIAAYMKNEKWSINEIKLTPGELWELIASTKAGIRRAEPLNFVHILGAFSIICPTIFVELLKLSAIYSGTRFQIVDPSEIEKMVDKILADNPEQLAKYRGSKTRLQGYFAGQVMKE